MAVKINELVIQVKVCEDNKQVKHPEAMRTDFVLNPTNQDQLLRDMVDLLADREAR